MNTDKIFAESIANEYAPKDTSKVMALRKLDARAKLPSAIFTYSFGIIMSLVLGIGMCLAMGESVEAQHFQWSPVSLLAQSVSSV